MEMVGGTEDPKISTNIDVQRLKTDLGINPEIIKQIAALDIPETVVVSSASPIKVNTVRDTLKILCPDRHFEVEGVKAPSGVDEQPLGQTSIRGALNRLENATRSRGTNAGAEDFAVISIENGLFRESHGYSQDVDLHEEIDPRAEYDDRAVAAIKIPGHKVVTQISPTSEAVRFPKSAIMAAVHAKGGLAENSAGSKLKEVGAVADNQNPHSELTRNRPGGPLPREDQMARVIARGIMQLTKFK